MLFDCSPVDLHLGNDTSALLKTYTLVIYFIIYYYFITQTKYTQVMNIYIYFTLYTHYTERHFKYNFLYGTDSY